MQIYAEMTAWNPKWLFFLALNWAYKMQQVL